MKAFVCFCVLMLATATFGEENPSSSEQPQSTPSEPIQSAESPPSPEVEKEKLEANSTDTADTADLRGKDPIDKFFKPIRKQIDKFFKNFFKNGNAVEGEGVVPTNATEVPSEAQIEAQTEAQIKNQTETQATPLQ